MITPFIKKGLVDKGQKAVLSSLMKIFDSNDLKSDQEREGETHILNNDKLMDEISSLKVLKEKKSYKDLA